MSVFLFNSLRMNNNYLFIKYYAIFLFIKELITHKFVSKRYMTPTVLI